MRLIELAVRQQREPEPLPGLQVAGIPIEDRLRRCRRRLEFTLLQLAPSQVEIRVNVFDLAA